jgi:hypothetical protein
MNTSKSKKNQRGLVRYQKTREWEKKVIVEKVKEDLTYGCFSRTERDIKVPRAKARYWFIKDRDQTFHAQTCGGLRKNNRTFEPWEKPVVFRAVIDFLEQYPHSTLQDISNELSFCFLRNVSVWV